MADYMSDEEFSAQLRPFVEAGLLREIGYNSHIHVTVFNMADTVYLLMPHTRLKGAAWGIACTHQIARGTLMNDHTFVRYVDSLSGEELHANTVLIWEGTFDAIMKYKEKTDKTGPTRSISRRFEAKMQRLRAKYTNGPYGQYSLISRLFGAAGHRKK